jgi:hypothetical protein
MAIAGLKQVPEIIEPTPSRAEEAVSPTIKLLEALGLVDDEPALSTSLLEDFTKLTELGSGRPYVELPATVTFAQLLKLANDLAVERGYDKAYQWPSFWVLGTEKESVTSRELNGSARGYTARLGLFSEVPSDYDPLLHFCGLPYDDTYREKKQQTQLEAIDQFTRAFTARQPGADLRTADQRDFLVWYIMDLFRGVEPQEIVLALGFMRVEVLGRRTVGGDSCVGDVYSDGGRAGFAGSYGGALVDYGVGFSAGFME